MGNKFIKIALGAVVALACLPIIVTTIASMVGDGGALADNETLSTLLNLIPACICRWNFRNIIYHY